jgi:hypothetical protein
MTKFEDWMITSAYDIAAMLPTDYKEATAVLALVHEMMDKVNRPWSAKPRRRPQRKAAGRRSK